LLPQKSQIRVSWFSFFDRLVSGWEIFYDDDGKYLRYVVSPEDQIFLVKRRL